MRCNRLCKNAFIMKTTLFVVYKIAKWCSNVGVDGSLRAFQKCYFLSADPSLKSNTRQYILQKVDLVTLHMMCASSVKTDWLNMHVWKNITDLASNIELENWTCNSVPKQLNEIECMYTWNFKNALWAEFHSVFNWRELVHGWWHLDMCHYSSLYRYDSMWMIFWSAL